MAISTASTADPPVFKTFMASLAALKIVSKGPQKHLITCSLVAGREMDHLIGSAMVSGAGMDEDTGDIAKLPFPLTRAGKHCGLDRRGQVKCGGSWLRTTAMPKRSNRALASGILSSRRLARGWRLNISSV